ncbi:MAG: prenyltransferase [Candidatus Bathyarchaeota archaeon]|nr:prenyltransferase [Candidatus Bathyarchaeota archaeon]
MKTVQKISLILRIVRSHIVAGGVLAFSLGVLLALVNGGTFDPLRAALFYTIVLLGDMSAHYSNDYFDVKVDQYAGKKQLFSGSNVLVNNPALRPLAKNLSITFLSFSIGLSVLAVVLGVAPMELLAIALAGNFLGWFYSAPPLRLISRGIGEVSIAFAAGFAVPALGYLSVAGSFDWWFALFVLPFVLYGFMLSLCLEAPDIEVDREGDKRTISARAGERFVFGLILIVALASFLIFVLYAGLSLGLVDFTAVAVFAAVPLATGILGFIWCIKMKNVGSVPGVLSLFVFNVAMVVYLATLLLAK